MQFLKNISVIGELKSDIFYVYSSMTKIIGFDRFTIVSIHDTVGVYFNKSIGSIPLVKVKEKITRAQHESRAWVIDYLLLLK